MSHKGIMNPITVRKTKLLKEQFAMCTPLLFAYVMFVLFGLIGKYVL